MSNFDSQKWYQITMKAYDKSNLLSLASDSHNGTGSAYFQITNTSSPNQQWQLFASTNNTYVLRSGESTSFGYLTTKKSSDDKATVNAGNTVPLVTNYYKLRDDSMYWSILPWGDGSFWMENAQNGTAWHLEKETNGRMQMSSNITKPQNGQSFIFKPLGKISQKAYGTLTMPPSDTEPSSSTTTLPGFTGTSTSSPTASASSPSGLSTAAQAGIGAGVGALALIAILLGLLFLMRRRKRRNNRTPLPDNGKTNHEYKYVEQQGSVPVAEMWQPPVELASGQFVKDQKKGHSAELPPNYPVQAQKMSSPVELDSRQLR